MKLINHVIFAIDTSGSMQGRMHAVHKVLDGLIADIKSAPIDTRISLYSFDVNVRRLCNDTPAANIESSVYNRLHASGSTALLDATRQAILDGTKTAADYAAKVKKSKKKATEDHTFLLYVITDGGENASRYINAAGIQNMIGDLDDSWTIAIMVPDHGCAHYAKMYGFPAGNIQIWDVNSKTGVEDVGRTITASYTQYNALRSAGVRSTSTIFAVDASKLAKTDIKNMSTIDGKLYPAHSDAVIKDFVETKTGTTYVPGTAYYELTKTEKVQPYKELVLVSKKDKDGKKYGGTEARQLLGLPSQEVKLKPGDHGDWRIFIQSTSLNRKIVAGTSVFVKS